MCNLRPLDGGPLAAVRPHKIGLIRWLRVSEGLARLGYQVDLIVNTPSDVRRRSRSLRIVPLARVRWDDYDLVKTSYHLGFANLLDQGVGRIR